MSRAVGIRGDNVALQNIYEFVKEIVTRPQGSCFASPKAPDLYIVAIR